MKKVKTQQEILIEKFLETQDLSSQENLQDLIQQFTKKFVEKAIEGELTNHLKYKKNEQNTRTISDNYRNGSSSKKLKTTAGKIQVDIPRDRNGTFEPLLIPKNQTTIAVIEDLVLKMFSKGISLADISDLVKAQYQVEISKDMISDITDKLYPAILEWQQRRLCNRYAFIFIDGIRFKVKNNFSYEEVSVYIVVGVNVYGYKDVLGFYIDESESARMWFNVLEDLKARGVEELGLVISDDLSGISSAIKTAFPKALIQKCVIHQLRNSFKMVRQKDYLEIANDMKLIYKASNLETAEKGLELLTNKWNKTYPRLVKSWTQKFDELTAFFHLPFEIRKMIYTTNIIENLNRQIRKFTKTKGGYVTGKALTKAVYSVIMNVTEKWNNRIHNWDAIINSLSISLNDDSWADIAYGVK